MKVSILALSVLVGGAVLASAANVTVYSTYSISSVFTNPTAAYWSVYGSPTTPSGYPEVLNTISCSTDGSGKITGAGMVYMDFSTNNRPFTLFSSDVTGKIGMKGSEVSVTMQINGTGMAVTGDGTGQPASYTVKFTGKPGPNPNTNSSQKTIIVGTAQVTLKGTPLGNNKSYTIKSLPMVINGASQSFVDFSGEVLQTLKQSNSGVSGKAQIFSSSTSGTANIKSGNYTASIKGIGYDKGMTLTITGGMSPHTNNIGTNPVVFLAPITATVTKGKINAQSVTGVPSLLNATLLY